MTIGTSTLQVMREAAEQDMPFDSAMVVSLLDEIDRLRPLAELGEAVMAMPNIDKNGGAIVLRVGILQWDVWSIYDLEGVDLCKGLYYDNPLAALRAAQE